MKTNLFNNKSNDVYCMYFDEEKGRSGLRMINLNDLHTYIQTGRLDNLPDLKKQDEAVKNDFPADKRTELIMKLPGFTMGFKFTKDFLSKRFVEFKPSNLLVFDFIADGGDVLDKLEVLNQLKCVLFSFNNYFGGKTLVVKTDNKKYDGTVWTFELINAIFGEWVGLSPDRDLGPNIVPLRYDPNVMYNPNAISFGEMIENLDFAQC